MELGNYGDNRRKALEALGRSQTMNREQAQPESPTPDPPPPDEDGEGKGSEDMTDDELAEAAKAGRLHLGDSDGEVDEVGGRYVDHLIRTGKATDTGGDISLKEVSEGESDLVRQYLDAHQRVQRGKPGGP